MARAWLNLGMVRRKASKEKAAKRAPPLPRYLDFSLATTDTAKTEKTP